MLEFYLYMCLPAHVCSTYESQKGASNPLELEL